MDFVIATPTPRNSSTNLRLNGVLWGGSAFLAVGEYGVAVTYPVAPTAPDVSTRYGPNWTGSITGTVSDAWDNTVSVQVEIQDTTDGLWWDGDTWAATQSRVTPTRFSK